MPITGPTGVAIWDEDDPFAVHSASAAQEVSIRNRINGKYATTTLRDTAYSGLTNSDKAGARCWVTERAGFCSHDGTDWRWDSQMRLLSEDYRSEPANLTGVTPGDLLLTGPYVMPGTTGFRRLLVNAHSYVTQAPGYSGSSVPRMFVEIPSGIHADQQWLESGQAVDLRISWVGFAASGTAVYPKLRALVAYGQPCSFQGAQMQVFDCGPA